MQWIATAMGSWTFKSFSWAPQLLTLKQFTSWILSLAKREQHLPSTIMTQIAVAFWSLMSSKKCAVTVPLWLLMKLGFEDIASTKRWSLAWCKKGPPRHRRISLCLVVKATWSQIHKFHKNHKHHHSCLWIKNAMQHVLCAVQARTNHGWGTIIHASEPESILRVYFECRWGLDVRLRSESVDF